MPCVVTRRVERRLTMVAGMLVLLAEGESELSGFRTGIEGGRGTAQGVDAPLLVKAIDQRVDAVFLLFSRHCSTRQPECLPAPHPLLTVNGIVSPPWPPTFGISLFG